MLILLAILSPLQPAFAYFLRLAIILLLRQASPVQGQLQQPMPLPLVTPWPSASLASFVLLKTPLLALFEHGLRQVLSAAIVLVKELQGGIFKSRRACLASQPSMHWSPESLAFDGLV